MVELPVIFPCVTICPERPTIEYMVLSCVVEEICRNVVDGFGYNEILNADSLVWLIDRVGFCSCSKLSISKAFNALL